MTGEWFADTDPCWLGSGAAAELLRRRITVPAGLSVALGAEVARARAQWRVAEQAGAAALDFVVDERRADLGAEGFELSRSGADLTIVARSGAGLLTGFLRLLTVGAEPLVGTHVPAYPVRMLNHWDNMVAGPMGTVERGYAGDSIFFADGAVRTDLTRVRDYARLVASIGINAPPKTSSSSAPSTALPRPPPSSMPPPSSSPPTAKACPPPSSKPGPTASPLS